MTRRARVQTDGGDALPALLLDGQGGAREGARDGSDRGPGETLWVHLDYGLQSSRRWLEEESGLSELAVEALLAEEPRPRSAVFDDALLVILRGVNLNDGEDPEDMVSLRMVLAADRVVSVRRRRLQTASAVRDALARGRGPGNAGELLSQLVDGILDRISVTVDDVDDTANALEDKVLELEGRELRPQLAQLRRKAIALRRYIAPQRDTISRLGTERVDWLADTQRAELREAGDRITRFVEDLDSARDRAAITMEELNNRLAEQMNVTMYRLSLVAAIFLPLGLLTGLLGINVGGVPGVDSPWAFSAVTIGLVLISIAQVWWFKRNRWF